jgi:citronellol/citronellal dehydrogenase
MEFRNKTVFVTGGSRGIGLAIALRLAREGANVAIAAKTAEPHPQLPGTIYTAADEIRAAGGQALPLLVDVRSDEQIKAAVEQTVATFGGIDILVNNASAIFLAGTLQTPMKRYDLMHQINARGTFATSQACLPYLLQSENPHIVNLSPPLNMNPAWFGHHLAYTMAKYGMSMCVLGMAEEFRHDDMIRRSRTPDIMGDACYYIVRRPSRSCTGNFFIDEEVLRQEGIHDLDGYAVEPGQSLQVDLFL